MLKRILGVLILTVVCVAAADAQTVKNGIFRTFYKNGKVHTEITYVNGKKDGMWNIYSERGVLAAQVEYKDDQPVGILKFDKDGKLKDGDYKDNYPDGSVMTEEHYSKGTLTGMKGYEKDGKLKYQAQWAGMQLKDFTVYDSTGKPLNGEVKDVYPNGKIRGTGLFKDGKPDGIFESYCEDGRRVSRKNLAGGVMGQYTTEMSKGQLICDDVFGYIQTVLGRNTVMPTVIRKNPQ